MSTSNAEVQSGPFLSNADGTPTHKYASFVSSKGDKSRRALVLAVTIFSNLFSRQSSFKFWAVPLVLYYFRLYQRWLCQC